MNKDPQIIYEDKEIIVLNKPAGMVVHPYGAKGKMHGEGESLADWLRVNRPEVKNVGDMPDVRPGIVHRLDKETSGIILVAKTERAFNYFKSLFAEREIKKTYIAAVSGILKNKKGIIDLPIGIRNGTVKRTVHGGRMIKSAATEYEVIRESENGAGHFSILRVTPKTGRTHQIRVHLAAIGHPILGDMVYGPKPKKTGKKKVEKEHSKLSLHAYQLEFKNIDGRMLRLETDFPNFELSTMLN